MPFELAEGRVHAPAREPAVYLVGEPTFEPRPQVSDCGGGPQSVNRGSDTDRPQVFKDSRGLARFVEVDLPPLAQSPRPVPTLLNPVEESRKQVESGAWPVPQLLRSPPLWPRSFPSLPRQSSLEVLSFQGGHGRVADVVRQGSLSIQGFKHLMLVFEAFAAGPVLAPEALDFLHGLGRCKNRALSVP